MGIVAMAGQGIWSEAQEKATYHPGQKVELKHHLGTIDTIIAYDPHMVPPIVLASDPQPRYPEELNLIFQPAICFNWLKPLTRAKSRQPQAGVLVKSLG